MLKVDYCSRASERLVGRLTTDLVAVGLRSQLLVQWSHLGCQMLESIPEFSLLVMGEKKNTQTGSIREVPFPHVAVEQSGRYLVVPLPLQPELAWRFAAGVLAAVEVHAPGAAEGERCAARVGVFALTCARSTAGGDSEIG